MNLTELRTEVTQHNLDHPELPNCIQYNCTNKINPTWDNNVLCHEHQLMMLYWFYEESGYKYCPETWNMEDFGDKSKMLPKPAGSDENMTAYRKRYCDWIAALSPEKYLSILKFQIGDES